MFSSSSRNKFTEIDGIILLDKPQGITSNRALQKVKKLLNAKKAGHTGSLDPLATGMLPLCFGEATKFSQYLLDANKNYQVSAKLGIKTTTGDLEGEIIAEKKIPSLTAELLEETLRQFRGVIEQIPPMYSALKHQGQPLYSFARRGIDISRPARQVEILHLSLISWNESEIHLEVACSKGTYIRTLVEDIGEALGCGAHVTELRRLNVCNFDSGAMFSLETLEKSCAEEIIVTHLLPIDHAVAHLMPVYLSSAATSYLCCGQAVTAPQCSESLVRVYSDTHEFLGIGEFVDGKLIPKRLVKKSIHIQG